MPRHDPIPPRPPRPPPHDLAQAARAWAHFRRAMRWTMLASLLTVAASLFWLWSTGPVGIHMLIATALGVGLSVMVAGALMGLIFLSDRSGHDDEAAHGDPYDDDRQR
jgi:hypothetical protein